jgi:hypothetical protein
MTRATINRLSDRRVKTVAIGVHADGGGLYLRMTEGRHGLSRYWLLRHKQRSTRKDRQLGVGPLDTVTLAAARECGEQLLMGQQDPIGKRTLSGLPRCLLTRRSRSTNAVTPTSLRTKRGGASDNNVVPENQDRADLT